MVLILIKLRQEPSGFVRRSNRSVCQESSGFVRWSNRPMREENCGFIRRSNRPVREQETSRFVRRSNRSMCHFERIVTAPIAKKCNTQEKRTTKKFFHCTLLFPQGTYFPVHLS